MNYLANTEGISIAEIGETTGISHPPGGYGVIISFKAHNGNQLRQLYIGKQEVKVRYKDGIGDWVSWITISSI